MAETIRLAVPAIDDADCEAVIEVLRSGYLVQGAKVAAFEHALASEIGTSDVVAVANCTAALHLGLLSLGIGPGCRVAVATYSWPSTVNAIYLVGAEPVFVDIESQAFGMDPAKLREALEAQRIDAVLPVHTFGGMADIESLARLSGEAGIPLMEDAACALGASMLGVPAGAWGMLGCFSFHPRKAITTGEGGAISTSDAVVGRRLRSLRNHGQDPELPSGHSAFVEPGYNLRLTEMQAALGLSQLTKLGRILSARRLGASRYDELLESTPIRTPTSLGPESHVYQSYVVLVPDGRERDRIISEMRDSGIEVTIGTYHQPLIAHVQRHGFRLGDFPITDVISAAALSLPLFEGITVEQQKRVVSTLLEAL
jgi:perosamine synthetase